MFPEEFLDVTGPMPVYHIRKYLLIFVDKDGCLAYQQHSPPPSLPRSLDTWGTAATECLEKFSNHESVSAPLNALQKGGLADSNDWRCLINSNVLFDVDFQFPIQSER